MRKLISLLDISNGKKILHTLDKFALCACYFCIFFFGVISEVKKKCDLFSTSFS